MNDQRDKHASDYLLLMSLKPLLLSTFGGSIDVAAAGVDGRGPVLYPGGPRLYELPDVTGVDAQVQAVVASQAATARSLLVALELIEQQDLRQFSFVCHGATHRSVSCCLLLAAITYPHARVYFTTRRTWEAADAAGLR